MGSRLLSASPFSALLSTACLLTTLHLLPCTDGAVGSCKLDEKVDPRNPRVNIQRCLITKDKDFNLIPRNSTALWVQFPKGNKVNFAAHFPTLPKLEYLKIDITYMALQPKAFEDNFQLPKLMALSIIRDLNEVDSQQIAITLEDDIFLGLFNLEELFLDNLGIQDLSKDALHGLDSLEILDLTLNYISEVKPFMFSHCKNLTTLKLTDNFISTIDESSFGGLAVLESLDISMNKLKVLPAGPLSSLKELKLLVATSNDLHTIENGAFAGLGKLHYLSLARNNLSEIDPLAFQGLTGLETFILDHNKVKLQMGQFAQASNILHLYMAHNDIKSITPDYFEGLLSITELILNANSIDLLESQIFYPMPTLITLDVGDNKIKHVEENAFQGLTSLQTLNIQENQIQTLPAGSFDDLTNVKTLYMDKNPWVCSCETEWLIGWLRERQNSIQPEAQFFFIVCSDDDPIPTETFHTLIISKHYFEELNCGEIFVPSRPNGKTTNKDGSQTSDKGSSSTTEKNVIKVPNKRMTKTQKVIIIVCSVLAVIALVAILAIHIYCRQKKQRSWVPPDQKKLDQQKSVLPQSKKVTSSYSDPEAGYWSRISDDLPQFYPNNNTSQSEVFLKAAGKSTAQRHNSHQLVHPETTPQHQQLHNHIYQNHSYISDSMEYIYRVTDINHQKRGDLSDTEQSRSAKYKHQQKHKQKSKKAKGKKKVRLGPQTVVQIEKGPNSTQQEQASQQQNGGSGHPQQQNQKHQHTMAHQLVRTPEKVRRHSKPGDSHTHSNQNTSDNASRQIQKLLNPSHTAIINNSQQKISDPQDGSLELQMELQSIGH